MKVEIEKLQEGQTPVARLRVEDETEDIRRLAEYIETEQYHVIKVPCYENDTLCYVDSGNIYYVESMNETLYLHTNEQIYESKKRLYEMERMLPVEFVRVSKSTILNMSQVRRYKPLPNGLMLAEFENKDAAYISRKYLRELRSRIKEGEFHEKS